VTRTGRVALLAIAVLAGTVLERAGVAAGSSAQLRSITSMAHPEGTSLTIEASEPVAYVTTQPDPLTLLLDFRDVGAGGLDEVAGAVQNPIARVSVEAAAADVPIARVRVALTEPVSHRVRSERSRVIVDFEKAAAPRRPSLLFAQQTQTPGAATQPPVPDQPTTGRGGRTYTGHPVSLDFQGADLRSVLRTFAEISGLNIVIDPAVQGSVDVALREVPWDQALDQILRANKLGYVVDGTIVRIAPLTVLAEEETQRLNLAEKQALAGELHVLTRTLSYARAEAMQTLITRSALSARGSVQIDPRTNTLIITDLEDRLQTAGELIDVLDKPQPQVEIEARIVQTTRDYARALGVQWGFNGRVDPALGNTTNMAFPNSGTLNGETNLPVSGASSVVGLVLGSVNGAFDLDVALSAMERTRNGRLLSTPRVSTQNNVAAEVTQGTQIPIQTVSNNTVTTAFKDAALSLKVTPQITAAGTVIMQIFIENATPDPAPFGIVPSISTQRAVTTVLVNDGQTTVIGGIYLSNERVTNDRTPGLGRIPLLSWLFKRDDVTEESRELLIFITPRIIQGVTQG
jgi:type IV pilus assembly protein PilQ